MKLCTATVNNLRTKMLQEPSRKAVAERLHRAYSGVGPSSSSNSFSSVEDKGLVVRRGLITREKSVTTDQ